MLTLELRRQVDFKDVNAIARSQEEHQESKDNLLKAGDLFYTTSDCLAEMW